MISNEKLTYIKERILGGRIFESGASKFNRKPQPFRNQISIYKRGIFRNVIFSNPHTFNSSKTKLTYIKERVLGGRIFESGTY